MKMEEKLKKIVDDTDRNIETRLFCAQILIEQRKSLSPQRVIEILIHSDDIEDTLIALSSEGIGIYLTEFSEDK